MQEQQWCTGCFSLVATSILYEKHSISCPFKENIKYSTSSNPNAVSKLPVLNRYPNNEELYKMVVALTDNLNKANRTISALKRKINLRTNNVDILEYLNENIVPSVSMDNILSRQLQIYDDEESEASDNEFEDTISIGTFYEVGFYSFVLKCLSSSMQKYRGIAVEYDLHKDDDSSFMVDQIDKDMSNLSIQEKEKEEENEKEKEDNTTPIVKSYIPPILCFKQKKDTIYIFEHNSSWKQYTVSDLSIDNFFNRFARLVNSNIMTLFDKFKSRHEKELYDADFQVVLSKRLKCICSINMDQEIIVSKIVKPWCVTNKVDLYEFMNCN
jgi:hypothetical protein